MEKRFLKKIIAQTPKDLQIISAFCSEAKVNLDGIKYLPKNKLFLLSVERLVKESEKNNKKINSIIKFEFIDSAKSININTNNPDLPLKLLAINHFKKENNYEILLLLSENGIITLSAEIIEVTLEDQKINDKSNQL